MLHGAALGVGRGEIEPADARERDRARAHGAGLQRHVEVAVDQPLGADRLRGGAQRQHLGMGRGVAVGQRAIARRRDHPPIPGHDGPDGDFAPGRGGARLGEGDAHGV